MEPLLSLIVGFLGLGTLVAFLSPFVVRLIVLLYPEDSPRRAEFVSEIEEVPVTGRVTYLAGVLATAICEATPERLNFAVRDLTLIRRAARVDRAEMESKGLNEGFAAAAGGSGFLLTVLGAIVLDPYGLAWLGMALGALLVISPVLAMTSPVVTAAWGWLVSAVRSLRTLGVDRDALVRELLGTIDD